MVDAPNLPEAEASYVINADGIGDYKVGGGVLHRLCAAVVQCLQSLWSARGLAACAAVRVECAACHACCPCCWRAAAAAPAGLGSDWRLAWLAPLRDWNAERL